MFNNKVSPEVDRLIKPIIMDMTQIDIAQQQNPIINNQTEPQDIKRRKRRCVHITFNGQDFVIRAKTLEDGRLVCPVCGQEIGQEFNDDAVDDYFRCLKRVNQLLFFGMLKGMMAGPIQGCLVLKELIPDAAKLHKELNMFVNKESQSNDSLENIGMEYATSDMHKNITGYHGY
jgi:hypothetical protein